MIHNYTLAITLMLTNKAMQTKKEETIAWRYLANLIENETHARVFILRDKDLTLYLRSS